MIRVAEHLAVVVHPRLTEAPVEAINGCTWYNVLARHPLEDIREESRKFDQSFALWLRSTVSRTAITGFPVPAGKLYGGGA